MRVTLVSSGSGSRGGGEIYLALLAEGLRRLNCQVVALVPDAPVMDELAERMERDAEVIRFPFRTTYQRRLRNIGARMDRDQRLKLAERFRSLRTDVLHVNQQVAEDGLDIVQAAALSRQPWVSTIHVGRSAQSLGARLGKMRDMVTRQTLRQVAGQHIAVCAAAEQQLVERLGHDRPRLHVVHNGVQVPDLVLLNRARAEARQSWNISEGEIVIGSVGRIEEQKNPAALIDNVSKLDAKVRAVWIGDGAQRDLLVRHAAASGVPLLIDGWRTDAAQRLAGLDIFLLPSRFEGLPLALLEAMHAGLPVVASRTDGTVEAIRHGETGFLCSTPAEWQSALRQLCGSPDLRAQLGRAARADAVARFSTEAMARRTLEVYRNLRASTAPGS